MMKSDKSHLGKGVTSGIPFLIYLLISFVEGGSVMAVELVGAKLVAPFYGNSLYVWASVLGITLGGLALGYFAGGWLSKKFPSERTLFLVLLAAALTVFWMGPLGTAVMRALLGLSIIPATLLSCLAFLFPPLLCFGMSSPIIIEQLNLKGIEAGRGSGMVYAVSTSGGILMTFATGFYFIPLFGLSHTLFVIGTVLFLIPFGYFLFRKRAIEVLIPLAFFWAILFSWRMLDEPKRVGENLLIRHRSEGLLGQLMVLDQLSQKGEPERRGLYVDLSPQTYLDLSSGNSMWPYVRRAAGFAAYHEDGKRDRALLCGLAGGKLANRLFQKGFEKIDAVELDPRMKEIALKYFDMDSRTRVHIDDARHFIKTTERNYDLVLFDLSLSETAPAHLYTIEAFKEVRKLLDKEGGFIIHYNNKWKGKGKLALSSIGKSLKKAGFKVRMINTKTSLDQFGERLFYAVPSSAPDPKRIYRSTPYFYERPFYQAPHELFKDSLSFEKGVVMKDMHPRPGILEANARSYLRKTLIQSTLQHLTKEELPVVQ